MKLAYVSLFCIISILSCTKSTSVNNNTIQGNWKATQWLNDPGDGSGVFTNIPVGNNYFMNFKPNGDFEGNALFNIDRFNKYLTSNNENLTLYKLNSTDSINIRYELTSANFELIVSFPCIEPCQLKLIRR